MMIIDNKPLVFLFFLQRTLAGEGELVGDLLRDHLDHHDPKISLGFIVVMWSKVISKQLISCLSNSYICRHKYTPTH